MSAVAIILSTVSFSLLPSGIQLAAADYTFLPNLADGMVVEKGAKVPAGHFHYVPITSLIVTWYGPSAAIHQQPSYPVKDRSILNGRYHLIDFDGDVVMDGVQTGPVASSDKKGRFIYQDTLLGIEHGKKKEAYVVWSTEYWSSWLATTHHTRILYSVLSARRIGARGLTGYCFYNLIGWHGNA